MWELLVTIGDLLERYGSGWSTLGDRDAPLATIGVSQYQLR